MRKLESRFQPGLTSLLLAVMLAVFLAGCDSKTPEEHIAAAEQHIAAGELNAAILEAKNALQKSSQFKEARVLLGRVYSINKDYQAARGEFEKALDLGSNDPELRKGLLNAKLRLGQVQEVLGELGELENPDTDMQLLLAEAYLMSGDPVAAKPLFAANAESALGQAGLASIAWAEGDRERALEHLNSAVEIDPNDADIWMRLAELQLVGGEYDAAMASFTHMLDLPGGRISGSIGQARTHLAQSQIEEAGVVVDNVLSMAPDYPLALYLRGLVSFQQDDLKGAELSLRKVQSRFPEHGPTQYLQGLVKYKLGQFSQAEDNLSRYLNRDEGNESVRKLLASVKFDRGDMEGVIDVLQKVESVSTDPQLFAMLGTARMRNGDLSEATTALERAVELAPDMAPFRNQLALSLLSAGKQDRAEAALEEAINVDSNQFQSDYLIAMLRLRERKYDEAAAAVDALISKSPDNPIGYNLRGAIALGQNRIDSARDSFEESLAKEPTFEPAAKNLARLFEAQGDVPEAQAVFQGVLNEEPSHEGALIGLAELNVRNGNVSEAVANLEKAVAGNPGSLKSRLGLTRLYVAQGQNEPAQTTINEALEIYPDHPDFLALQAQLDLAANRRDEAQRAVTKLQAHLAANPQNKALTALVGDLQLRLGNRTMARRNLERLVELGGPDSERSAALLRLARLDLADGQHRSANRRLADLRKIEGIDEGVLLLLEGDIRAAEGKNGEAERFYQRLAQRNDREGVMRLASLKFRAEDEAAGQKILRDWLARNESDQGARALLAGALLNAGAKQDAVAEYERLQATGNPIVLNNLAWLYMEQKDSRAVEIARKAYEAAPENPDVIDTYGWILVQMDSAEQGVLALEKSNKLRPSNPTVLYHLAVGYQKTGKLRRARQALEAALDLGGFDELQNAKDLLSSLN